MSTSNVNTTKSGSRAKGAAVKATSGRQTKAADSKVKSRSQAKEAPSKTKSASQMKAAGSKASSRSRAKGAMAFDDFFEESKSNAKAVKPINTINAKPKQKPGKKRKVKRKLTPIAWLLRAFITGCCLLLAWCLFAYYMVMFHEQQDLHKADAGIILGAALWNDQPSPALRERLDYAIQLYEEGLVDYLILSGGKPSYSRGLSEAEGMQQYLIQAGIPEQQLLLEAQSRDTYENILFSKRVLEKEGLQSVLIITHNYHTKRAADIAEYIGLEHTQTAGAKTTVLNESYHYTREMLAFSKWQLNKLLIPLGITI